MLVIQPQHLLQIQLYLQQQLTTIRQKRQDDVRVTVGLSQ